MPQLRDVRAARSTSAWKLVVGRNPGGKRGISVHRVAALDGRDIRRHRDRPAIAPARALVDVATQLTMRELERGLEEALTKGLLSEAELAGALARHRRRSGSLALGRLVKAAGDPAITRSDAEERFLVLARRATLTRPEVNNRIGPHIVDFLHGPALQLASARART